MTKLSRKQREEGMKQVQELQRRLRENDWDDVEVDSEDEAPIRVWRKRPSSEANPPPPGYKDAD